MGYGLKVEVIYLLVCLAAEGHCFVLTLHLTGSGFRV
jgi:hypothetical protein